MVDVIREWAGKERLFRLTFGGVMDLEQATGDAIGDIFLRVASSRFKVSDIYHTIRLSLIGGGLGILDAKRLIEGNFDKRPYLESAALAGEILTDLMAGIEPTDEKNEGRKPEAIRFSEASQICRVFNLSPLELRQISYADFVNMLRGYNAASDRKPAHLSEEEFIDILNRYEPEAMQ